MRVKRFPSAVRKFASVSKVGKCAKVVELSYQLPVTSCQLRGFLWQLRLRVKQRSVSKVGKCAKVVARFTHTARHEKSFS